MYEGFIKLYRSILEDPVIMKDADHFAIWCYLLLKATHSEREVDFNGKIITLHPGELITGRKKVEKDLKINEHKVDRILGSFSSKNRQLIEQQTSSKGRLIKVLNWNKTQNTKQQIEQQMSNKCTTSEQQVSTNKNEKNKKNDKNEKNMCVAEPQKDTVSHFQKPTLEELQGYCDTSNINVDAELFFNYYEGNGWRLSNGLSMQDWQAQLRYWAQNEAKKIQGKAEKDINHDKQYMKSDKTYTDKDLFDVFE